MARAGSSSSSRAVTRLGRLQQGGRTVLTLREPAEQQDQLGARRPPRTLLAAEQPQGFGAAILREAEVAGRGGGDGGGVQQLGAPGRRAVVLSILATAASTSRRASRARPAASSTVHLLTNRSATKIPS